MHAQSFRSSSTKRFRHRVWPSVVAVAAACAVLQLETVSAVPLTQELYKEIASGAKESKIVTSIPYGEFADFEGDVTLGEMPLLQSIGNIAFLRMKGVLVFQLNDCEKLTRIGDQAFQGMDNTASIISIGAIPLLESVGQYAFNHFRGELKFEAGPCVKLKTIGDAAFSFTSNSKTVVSFGAVPALQSIGRSAFQLTTLLFFRAGDCTKLTKIDIMAFANNDNAESVITLGATPMLQTIGIAAFKSVKGASVLRFGDCDKLTTIAEEAFNAWSSDSNADSVIAIGATPLLKSIGRFAFEGMAGILTLELGDCHELITIGNRAFYLASDAKNVITIGATPKLVSIGENVFAGMLGVLSLQLGYCEKLTTVGSTAFSPLSNADSKISIGAAPLLKSVGERAFNNMKGVLSINAGACPNLVSIDKQAFSSMQTSDSYIAFEDLKGLEAVGDEAFADFKGAFSLGGFSSNLVSVGAAAFRGTPNIKSVIFLASKGSTPELELELASTSTFGGTIKYGEIIGCGSSDDDVPLTKEVYEAVQLLSDDEKADKEKEITCIPANEFINYGKDVTLGVLPKLTNIDGSAFRRFANTLTIGAMKSLLKVSRNAFAGSTGKITIAAGDCTKLLTIESFAFANVVHTRSSVTIGATPALKLIERNAFETFKGVLKFSAGEMKALIKIPLKTFASVSNTASAVLFGALPNVGLLDDAAFQGFAGTLSIGALPALTSVKKSAFHGCTGILTIDVGDCPKLTTIEASAFESVSNLKSSVAFGATSALAAIGKSAFKAMKGQLTFAAGDVPALTKLESSTFAAVTNSKSSIMFTNLKKLASIEAFTFNAFTGTIIISGTPDYPKLTAVHASAFDGTSNIASVAILPQEGKTPLLKNALSGRFGGTIIHRADPGSPCEQKTSAGTWGECTTGRSSACKFHCCSLDVDASCLSCGSDGSCYDLAYAPSDAARLQRDAWPKSMLELQKATLPVDEIVNANSTLKRGPSSQAVIVQYKLKWSTDDDTSSVSDLDGPPPRTGLTDSGKGNDPGSVIIDAKTGVVTYNPDRAGTYTMWLIAYEVDEKGIEVHNQPDVPPEFDQVALARWEFEVKPIPKFGMASSWDPKGNSITGAMQAEYLLNEAHSFPAPLIPNKDLFVNALDNDLNADFDSIIFKLKVSSSPGKLLVDTETGEMLMLPEKIDTGYTLSLLAVDKRGSVAIVVDAFEFSVVEPPAFKIGVDETGPRREVGDKFDDYDIITKYVTGESYRIAPRQLIESETTVSSGEFKNIKYALEGAPDGWFVGTDNGQITGVFDEPTEVSKPITMTLNAVDEGGQIASVENYTFTVVKPPEFVLRHSKTQRTRNETKFTDPTTIDGESTFYAVGDAYQIAPLELLNTTEFSTVGGTLDSLRYALNGSLPDGLFVKTTSGEILVSFTDDDKDKKYMVELVVVDGAESRTLETMQMHVRYRDIEDPDLNNQNAFGPNNKLCEHGGVPFDDEYEFDQNYQCDCSNTGFTGANCETEIPRVIGCPVNATLDENICKYFDLAIDATSRKEKNGTEYADPEEMEDTFYAVGEAYRVAPFEIDASATTPSIGGVDGITYTLNEDAPDNFFLSTTSGELFWQFGPRDNGTDIVVTLFAIDKGGARQSMETIKMKALYKDIDAPGYVHGPNSKACLNEGIATDDENTFDGAYTCSCLSGWDGDNCENVAIFCQDDQIVLADGNCTECVSSSVPNDDQTECVVLECKDLEANNMCTCDLADLTDEMQATIELKCDGSRWPALNEPALVLPKIVTQLTLSGVEPERLPALLQDVSDKYKASSAAATRIDSVIVDQEAFAVVVVETPNNASLASVSSVGDSAGTDAASTSVAIASRSIEPMSACQMDGLVPATDFGIPIGVCSKKDAGCNSVCPLGEFADLESSGACTPCERGGFYADTEGRVGFGSHCACTPCKNGTWALQPGASDPNEECVVCPSGTQSDTPAGYRACPCLANFSRTDRFGKCSTCEGVLGIKCEADARVLKEGYFWQFPTPAKESEYLQFTANLLLSSGYNRSLSLFNGTYPKAYACPTPENCRGVTSESASSCLDGTTGPLCAVCEDTHFRLNGVCSACPESQGGSIVSMILILAVFVIVFVLILRQNAKDIPFVDEWNPERDESKNGLSVAEQEQTRYVVQFMTLVKIVLGYTQIKALIQEVYPGVQWPSSYKSFTGGLQFMSSNPLSIVMPSCLSTSLIITAYSEFLIAAWTPLILAPILVVYYKIKARNLPSKPDGVQQEMKDGKRDPYTVQDLQALCISTACFVYYLLYPTIAVASVRLLAKCDPICRNYDGNGVASDCSEYLRADYSIQCDGENASRHNGYKAAAGIAFVVYSIAIPAAIAVLLRRGRQGSAKGLASALMAGFSFYTKQYKPGYYFWETVDLYRKLFVTSMVVFIADGTSMQVSFGIMFAVVGMVLQALYSPYIHTDENRLALAAQAITVLALIVGGLIRASAAEEGALMKSGNIDTVVTGAYLVTSGVLLYCMALVSFILYRYYKGHTTAAADGDADDGATAASKMAGELDFVVFNAAQPEPVNSDEVLYTEVDVGTSRKNLSGRNAGGNGLDLTPSAIEETNFDGTISLSNNLPAAAAGYLDVGETEDAIAIIPVQTSTAPAAAGSLKVKEEEQFDGFENSSDGTATLAAAVAESASGSPAPAPAPKTVKAVPRGAAVADGAGGGFPEGFVVGAHCSVTGIACKGVIRFLGPLADKPEKFRVGIELDEPLGKHNGTPKGTDRTYFVCGKKHGVLVPQGKVQLETARAEEFSGFTDSGGGGGGDGSVGVDL